MEHQFGNWLYSIYKYDKSSRLKFGIVWALTFLERDGEHGQDGKPIPIGGLYRDITFRPKKGESQSEVDNRYDEVIEELEKANVIRVETTDNEKLLFFSEECGNSRDNFKVWVLNWAARYDEFRLDEIIDDSLLRIREEILLATPQKSNSLAKTRQAPLDGDESWREDYVAQLKKDRARVSRLVDRFRVCMGAIRKHYPQCHDKISPMTKAKCRKMLCEAAM